MQKIKTCGNCQKEILKGKFCSKACCWRTNKLVMSFKGSKVFNDILLKKGV